MNRKRNVKVIDGDPPVPREILAEAIVRMSEAAHRLAQSGLNERAIIVLVHDAIPQRFVGGRLTKPERPDIQAVFDALKTLRARYCKP